MESEIIVAADLGSSKIAVMSAQKNPDGRLEILGVDSVATSTDNIKNGIITMPSEVSGSIIRLATLMSNRIENKYQLKRSINKMYITMSGRSLRTQNIAVMHTFDKPSLVTGDVLQSLVDKAKSDLDDGLEIYKVFPKKFVLDGAEVFQATGKKCTTLECHFLVVVGRADIQTNLNKFMERTTGIEMMQQSFAPLLVGDVVATDEEKSGGCVVVDFGAQTTNVVIYVNGEMVHFAVVPFGGDDITRDLTSLNLPNNIAEKFKQQKCTIDLERVDKTHSFRLESKDATTQKVHAFEAAETALARFEEIWNMIWDEVQKTGLNNVHDPKIVITGGGANLSGIEKVIEQKNGIAVRKASFYNLLQPTFGSDDYDKQENALLLGLLMQGDEECTILKEVKTNADNQPVSKHKGKKAGESKSNILDRIVGGLFGNETPIE